MEKKYVIAMLDDFMGAIEERKLHVVICGIDSLHPNKATVFYDTFEEAERELMTHYNGINVLLFILPVYTRSLSMFKEKLKII